jgi:CBS domain-containing protein
MRVREVTTGGIEAIDPGTTIRDAATRMRGEDVGALPVGEDDRLIGTVTDRDIAVIAVRAVAEGWAPGETTVRDVMSDGVHGCLDTDDTGRASEPMAAHRVRRLPVMTRDKRLVGIVALADLARAGPEGEALARLSEPTAQPRGQRPRAGPAGVVPARRGR